MVLKRADFAFFLYTSGGGKVQAAKDDGSSSASAAGSAASKNPTSPQHSRGDNNSKQATKNASNQQQSQKESSSSQQQQQKGGGGWPWWGPAEPEEPSKQQRTNNGMEGFDVVVDLDDTSSRVSKLSHEAVDDGNGGWTWWAGAPKSNKRNGSLRNDVFDEEVVDLTTTKSSEEKKKKNMWPDWLDFSLLEDNLELDPEFRDKDEVDKKQPSASSGKPPLHTTTTNATNDTRPNGTGCSSFTDTTAATAEETTISEEAAAVSAPLPVSKGTSPSPAESNNCSSLASPEPALRNDDDWETPLVSNKAHAEITPSSPGPAQGVDPVAPRKKVLTKTDSAETAASTSSTSLFGEHFSNQNLAINEEEWTEHNDEPVEFDSSASPFREHIRRSVHPDGSFRRQNSQSNVFEAPPGPHRTNGHHHHPGSPRRSSTDLDGSWHSQRSNQSRRSYSRRGPSHHHHHHPSDLDGSWHSHHSHRSRGASAHHFYPYPPSQSQQFRSPSRRSNSYRNHDFHHHDFDAQFDHPYPQQHSYASSPRHHRSASYRNQFDDDHHHRPGSYRNHEPRRSGSYRNHHHFDDPNHFPSLHQQQAHYDHWDEEGMYPPPQDSYFYGHDEEDDGHDGYRGYGTRSDDEGSYQSSVDEEGRSHTSRKSHDDEQVDEQKQQHYDDMEYEAQADMAQADTDVDNRSYSSSSCDDQSSAHSSIEYDVMGDEETKDLLNLDTATAMTRILIPKQLPETSFYGARYGQDDEDDEYDAYLDQRGHRSRNNHHHDSSASEDEQEDEETSASGSDGEDEEEDNRSHNRNQQQHQHRHHDDDHASFSAHATTRRDYGERQQERLPSFSGFVSPTTQRYQQNQQQRMPSASAFPDWTSLPGDQGNGNRHRPASRHYLGKRSNSSRSLTGRSRSRNGGLSLEKQLSRLESMSLRLDDDEALFDERHAFSTAVPPPPPPPPEPASKQRKGDQKEKVRGFHVPVDDASSSPIFIQHKSSAVSQLSDIERARLFAAGMLLKADRRRSGASTAASQW